MPIWDTSAGTGLSLPLASSNGFSANREMDNNNIPEKRKKRRQKNRRQHLPSIYWAYLTLMIATLALFSVYALFCDDIAFTFTLNKMDIERYADSTAVNQPGVGDTVAVGANLGTPNAARKVVAAADTLPIRKNYLYSHMAAIDTSDSSGVRFLLIGDSMNEFLRLRLNDYCLANGHKMDCVIWYGATTKQYGTCDTIAYFIRKFHPTYVLLTIGSNELFIRDIVKHRTPYVQHIIEQLGNVPYVWIGPPNWKDDTGINDLIVSHVGTSRYFESKRLTFKRCKDGAHPVKSSALKWMDTIATYIATEARVPVTMNDPDTFYNKVPHTTILEMVKE